MATFHVPDVEVPVEPGMRIGELLARPTWQTKVVIVGFPSDSGVRIRGQRTGAAAGPDAIRRELYHLTLGDEALGPLLEETEDLGNLVLSGHLDEDQERLGKTLAPYLKEGALPIVLGGDSGATFGHFLGYVKAVRRCALLAWDGQCDVQEFIDGQVHSGSALRQAMLDPSGILQRCEVAGLSPHLTSKSEIDFLSENGGHFVWEGDLSESRIDEAYAPAAFPMMVSMDMGALNQSLAPGVSWPNAGGMERREWLYAARMAGETDAVGSFELVEVCPAHDPEGCTARFAAYTLWHFLQGLSRRRSS